MLPDGELAWFWQRCASDFFVLQADLIFGGYDYSSATGRSIGSSRPNIFGKYEFAGLGSIIYRYFGRRQ